MSTWPDAPELRAFLARASRRLAWIAALEGAAAGLALALFVPLALVITDARGALPWAIGAGLALGALGLLLRLLLTSRAQARVAQRVERRAPQCRNLLVTATELIERPARVRPYVGTLVCGQATRLVNSLRPAALFPLRRALTVLGATTVLFALALMLSAQSPNANSTSSPAAPVSASISRVDVSVLPPAYTARPATTLRDPARIEALAGSRIRVAVHAQAAAVFLETIGGRQQLEATDEQTFASELVADADGYIVLEATVSNGQTAVRRLIGLSVTPDGLARVRVTAPGRDLFFPDPHRRISVSLEADDDLGLASLRLRYTRVSGSGERFTFGDGDVPLEIVRTGVRRWTARGVLRLDSLQLEPGDLVVYRGLARDHRPGAVPSESDAYIVEITAPGGVAAAGFAIADDEERYGISQQMVILKTEQLRARAPNMAADSVSAVALALAAEQRAVRAEFVFMMGGELAEEVLAEASMEDLDEAAHAEADDEAIAGRLANRGRLDLLRAIRSMSRANAALNATNLTSALAEEKAALAALERAFSRTRYILRALTQRERLDLARRLTGELSAVMSDTRPRAEPESDARIGAMRRALADAAELAAMLRSDARADATTAARASRLAESVLRIDPSAESLQQVATLLTQAAAVLGRGRGADARNAVERAALDLANVLRGNLSSAPRSTPPLELGRLDGALTDGLRRVGAR